MSESSVEGQSGVLRSGSFFGFFACFTFESHNVRLLQKIIELAHLAVDPVFIHINLFLKVRVERFHKIKFFSQFDQSSLADFKERIETRNRIHNLLDFGRFDG